jgi:O-acetyl-ADP-ribose deacetylase
MSITVVTADLTRLALDAIVNAANPGLLGGGGVDGAIHRAAGPGLLAACRALPEVSPGVRCPTGEARLTPGFDLPARFVIHTVGPVWHGGQNSEAERLAGCYRSCIALALEHGLCSIGFPAITNVLWTKLITSNAWNRFLSLRTICCTAKRTDFDELKLTINGVPKGKRANSRGGPPPQRQRRHYVLSSAWAARVRRQISAGLWRLSKHPSAIQSDQSA